MLTLYGLANEAIRSKANKSDKDSRIQVSGTIPPPSPTALEVKGKMHKMPALLATEHRSGATSPARGLQAVLPDACLSTGAQLMVCEKKG